MRNNIEELLDSRISKNVSIKFKDINDFLIGKLECSNKLEEYVLKLRNGVKIYFYPNSVEKLE